MLLVQDPTEQNLNSGQLQSPLLLTPWGRAFKPDAWKAGSAKTVIQNSHRHVSKDSRASREMHTNAYAQAHTPPQTYHMGTHTV